MSKYTTELRYVCETAGGLDNSTGYNSVNQIIDASWDKIFNFDFPIFDESYRSVLCKKILKHYYTREIGLETVGLWKLKLDTKMNEIMPYYNKLYESELLQFDPLKDVDLITTNEKTIKSDGKTDTSASIKNIIARTNKNTDRYSDTPQGSLVNIESNEYLTNARIDDSEYNENNDGKSTGTTNQNINTTEEYINKIAGKSNGSVTYSAMLKGFRETLLNIDMMIIEELNELFMLVW